MLKHILLAYDGSAHSRKAAEEIINVAEVRQCDLIVMGLRGLGALRGLLLGSHTSESDQPRACPVLVVR